MKFKFRSLIALSSAFIMIIALATGCNTAGRTNQPPNQNGAPQIGQDNGTLIPGQDNAVVPDRNNTGMQGILPNTNTSPGGIRLNQQGQQNTDQATFDTQRANKIKNQLKNMKEIKNANVVVRGNTALIGYTPSNNTKDTNKIRNTLNSKVKQIDSSIVNVVATDKSNMNTTINKLAGDIANSRPANDLANRFNKIVQTITAPAGR
ncbi:MAG: YhcN/YlaJ family sporulation lipoprotein [Clostridia bacterium]|nr:YhcN/YlaJ family sporulation lipoprotein [Clostridia bacterium]